MEYNLSRLEWHFISDYPISVDCIASAITTGTKTKKVQDIYILSKLVQDTKTCNYLFK